VLPGETRYGIEVTHPRYLVIPKVGMTAAPWLMAQACKKEIGRIIDEGYDFDAIDAHYFYPDGVAAVMIGKYFNKPVVITARGTDINLIPQYALPRKQLMWAASNASAMITVCKALRDEMIGLGIDGTNIVALRNGVDLQRFVPTDRASARAQLGIDGFTVISVGVLDPRKAHDLTIGALPLMPDVKLLLAGIGPERKKLEALAAQLGVADRVTFLGAVPQAELKTYYNAADAMILASSREGWANVLLESMACGTPVVASNVWGTPEVVAAPEAGVLMRERTSSGIAEAVATLRGQYPDHDATRRYAEGFSWDDTTEGQLALFTRIIGERAGQPARQRAAA
jgi:glycosyltransferase involved in cell wall biosynthesis